MATIKELPAARVLEPTKKILTTSSGRKLTIEELTPLEEYRLASAVGATDAINPVTMTQATMATMVRDIDGVPLMAPTTKRELESSIVAVGRDGFTAVGNWMLEQQEAVGGEDAAGN